MIRGALRWAALAASGWLGAVGCRDPAAMKRELQHPATYAELTPAQTAEVVALRDRADATPADYLAQKEAGLRMMDYALSGVLPLQPEAERYLERAFALRDDDPELLRTLGRFYNMRAVEHDFSKAALQQRVYGALLGAAKPEQLSVSQFVSYSFFQLARIIEPADERRMLVAFSRLRRLERALARRTAAAPDDVELHALAGNFALFFAGYVPVGQRKRLRRGVEHFEHVKAHWAQLRPGARDELRCPNTYENFVFELGEAYLALGDEEQARAIYAELVSVREPITSGKELIAAASEHRLAHLPEYAGRTELMPPWPSDVGNCIVCHAYTSDLPVNTLYVAPGLHVDLHAKASRAVARPVLEREPTSPGEPATRPGSSPLVSECRGCHVYGGRAYHILDVANPSAVLHARAQIIAAIESGTMPPDRTLSAAQRQALVEHVRGLDDR